MIAESLCRPTFGRAGISSCADLPEPSPTSSRPSHRCHPRLPIDRLRRPPRRCSNIGREEMRGRSQWSAERTGRERENSGKVWNRRGGGLGQKADLSEELLRMCTKVTVVVVVSPLYTRTLGSGWPPASAASRALPPVSTSPSSNSSSEALRGSASSVFCTPWSFLALRRCKGGMRAQTRVGKQKGPAGSASGCGCCADRLGSSQGGRGRQKDHRGSRASEGERAKADKLEGHQVPKEGSPEAPLLSLRAGPRAQVSPGFWKGVRGVSRH